MHRAPQHLRTYFITTSTANRRRLFQVEANAQLLLDVLMEQRAKNRFHLHAFVLMPDHLHAILTPAPTVSLETAVQFIKGNFSHRLKSKLPVWTPSFSETQIRDLESFESRLGYIHQNPVRANLVAIAEEFPYSSASKKHLTDPTPEHLAATFAGAESPSFGMLDSGASRLLLPPSRSIHFRSHITAVPIQRRRWRPSLMMSASNSIQELRE